MNVTGLSSSQVLDACLQSTASWQVVKDVVCELLLLLSARVPVVILAPVEFVLRDNTTEKNKQRLSMCG